MDGFDPEEEITSLSGEEPILPGDSLGEAVDTDGDLAELFAREAASFPLLTREEERELAVRCAEGDKEAETRLIQSNLRLVEWVARKYVGRGLDYCELLAEGCLGLRRAVIGFKPEKGTRLSTYATAWIRKAVSDAVIQYGSVIRLPNYVAERQSAVRRAEESLTKTLSRRPTDREIAEETGFPEEGIALLRSGEACVISLNLPADGEEDEESIMDLIADEDGENPAEYSRREAFRAAIGEAMNRLTEKEQTVIRLKYGLDGPEKTLKEIAALFGDTENKINGIKKAALKKMIQDIGNGGWF